uniref:Fibronectin type-III domain-containing protein n=1 Tax=Macrostomum lignano TaxID=282301 RepID=A0A1I8F9G7_9PLAT
GLSNSGRAPASFSLPDPSTTRQLSRRCSMVRFELWRRPTSLAVSWSARQATNGLGDLAATRLCVNEKSRLCNWPQMRLRLRLCPICRPDTQYKVSECARLQTPWAPGPHIPRRSRVVTGCAAAEPRRRIECVHNQATSLKLRWGERAKSADLLAGTR